MHTRKQNLLIRNFFLPKVVFIPYFLSKVILTALNLFTYNKFKRNTNYKSKLCIESGVKGWELIDYKELYYSSSDYLGENNVYKLQIEKDKSYLKQIYCSIKTNKPTHCIYDPRTGSQNWVLGLLQSFFIAILYQYYGIVPISVLTDLPVRAWRAQSAVVTAQRGIVICLMSPKDIFRIFPHRRLIGPITMPFSRKTLKLLDALRNEKKSDESKSIIFTGSLYEPRTTILNQISEKLKEKRINLEVKGRPLGSVRISDIDYWERLVNASMVFTTANQISSKQTDWDWIPHLIYRYLEVTASGSLLIANEVPSLERIFKPGIDYISFNSIEDAVCKIEYYWNNKSEMELIAKNGNLKARSLIEINAYWLYIDLALGKYSLL